MKSRFLLALAGCASMMVFSTAGQAQSGYDTQALRFEATWGNVRIHRGSDDVVVGTTGWFRDFDIEKLLATSPRALAEARDYKTKNFRGSVLGGVGALTALVGVAVAANGSNNASSPILIIAGVSGMVWGAQHLSMSYAALSRALWWYNRDAASLNGAHPKPAREATSGSFGAPVARGD
jgi:hypothetical protein